jgi:hypothetical protein
MTDMTPAQAQAARLARIATHLLAHQDLSEVIVHQRHLQIPHGVDRLAALLAWTDTLSAPSMHTEVIKGNAYCYVTGGMFGQRETVWVVVDGFAPYVDADTSLDTLRAFASKSDGAPC